MLKRGPEKGGRRVKMQWNLILGLVFALLVAIVAIANVEPVSVNYLFGRQEVPLILVILGSSLAGALVVGFFGIVKQYRLQRQIRQLQSENRRLNEERPEPAGMADPGSFSRIVSGHEEASTLGRQEEPEDK
jgi:uncharacterized integral membrane protein